MSFDISKNIFDTSSFIGLKEEAILILLEKQGEMYGLEIQNAVEYSGNERVNLSIATLYPLLRKLENRKLIESRREEIRLSGDRKGNRRVYYRITQLGLYELDEVRQFRYSLSCWGKAKTI